MSSEDLNQALEVASEKQLSPSERASLIAAQEILVSSEDKRSTLYQLRLATSHEELRGFASDARYRHQAGLDYQLDLTERIHGRLSLALAEDSLGNRSTILDNSYIAFDWNDWTYGLGRIDRWWGPGWQTSLILSNNARPSPGAFISRNTMSASDLPIVEKLGPWGLTVFGNQLEGNRHIPHAKLLGFRFVAQPLENLEIGFSRTAQWGGEGRPESLSNLWKLITGQDNRGDDGIGLDGANEPGNQLAGVDWRWTVNLAETPITIYGQLIGEDEAGGLPSRHLGMLGIEMPLVTSLTHGRLFVEASDTTMRFWDDPIPNSAYNHTIYQSGYRYYGDVIGASSDNDSRTLTLGGYHETDKLGSLTWKAVYARINRDGIESGNQIAPNGTNTLLLSFDYTKPLNENASVHFGGYHSRNPIAQHTDFSDTGLSIGISLLK